MGAQMRAGRSFIEALESLADRLMIPEARSLVAVLRQTAELGSDIAEALRVFGDEMRDKRLLRAEEQAAKLSVKMLVPLAFFIFPVVLMVIVTSNGGEDDYGVSVDVRQSFPIRCRNATYIRQLGLIAQFIQIEG